MGKLVLGIETSCDETSAAVVAGGSLIRSNVIASQIDIHRKYGGVVPEIASRKHLELALPVIQEALEQAGVTLPEIEAIAVTRGPGLVGALLVGVAVAKSIAYARRLPLVGVNHLEGHIYANFLHDPSLIFPLLCLIVSGGHSDLVLIRAHGDYTLLGKTRDDAAGEAFDKVARVLGLGYPGGPVIDRLAREGNPAAIEFPRVWLEDGTDDFSFSGLKTAVINYWHKATQRGETVSLADMAASFQQAVVDVLVAKTIAAAKAQGVGTIILAGGVAANSGLRAALQQSAAAIGCRFSVPPLILCTDNAAMIACAGYYRLRRGETDGLDLNAVPYLPLGE